MPKSPPKLDSQLARLALARLPGEEVEPLQRVEWTAYRWVLLAAGIDPQTLEWDGRRYCEADVRERLTEPLANTWGYLHATVTLWPPWRHVEWSPVYALGCALRGLFGLTHQQVGSHKTGYYKVDVERLERVRTLLREEQHGE